MEMDRDYWWQEQSSKKEQYEKTWFRQLKLNLQLDIQQNINQKSNGDFSFGILNGDTWL